MTVIVTPAEQDDAKLAAQIVVAIKALDAADTVRKEKAIIAGNLLAEAQKRHPGKKAFEKFLELAGGIHISRAQTLIAIALGRKDFEQSGGPELRSGPHRVRRGVCSDTVCRGTVCR